jgi:choline dehydrogenase-like flavoprotein
MGNGKSIDSLDSGGTAGPVIAGRLSEDPDATILVLEAGKDSAEMDNMHMAGA